MVAEAEAGAVVSLGSGGSVRPQLVSGVLTAHASAFGAKGTRLFSPCGATVVCHSAKTTKALGSLGTHSARITAVCAGNAREECGEPLASGCEAGELRLWDSKACQQLGALTLDCPIIAIRWPRKNILLVLIGQPGQPVSVERIDVTSLAAPKRDGELPIDGESAGPFDAADDAVALCEAKGVSALVEGWAEPRRYVGKHAFSAVTVDPDKRFLATGDERGVVLLWWGIFDEGSAHPTQARWHWHAHPVRALKMCGPLLLSGGDEGVLCIRSVDEETVQFIPRFPAPLRHITCSHDGQHIAVSLEENSIGLIDGLHGWVKPKYVRALDVPIMASRSGNNASKFAGAALHVLPGGGLATTGGGRRVQFLDGFGKVIPSKSLELDRANTVSGGDPMERWVLRQVAFSARGECMLTCEARRSPALEKFEEGATVRSHVLKWWRRTENGQFELDSMANEPHSSEVTVALAHPQQEQVFVTASLDGSFKTWDWLPAGSIAAKGDGEGEEKKDKGKQYCWQCTSHGSWRGRPALSGCFAADGSALALGFHGFVVLWDHESLTELGALPAGEGTDRVTQLASAMCSDRFLLLANVKRASSSEVICWDLAQLAVVARLDLSPALTSERRCVMRVAPAVQGDAAGAGLRLLAYQAQGTKLKVWRLAPSSAGSTDLSFKLEASGALPKGRHVLDAAFAADGNASASKAKAAAEAAPGAGCPVLTWTADYELWHLDIAPTSDKAKAPKDGATKEELAVEEDAEPAAKVLAASGRALNKETEHSARNAEVPVARGEEGLSLLNFPQRTTAAQQSGLVPSLVEKIAPAHVPSHLLPPPPVLWDRLCSVYGKPSASVVQAEADLSSTAKLPAVGGASVEAASANKAKVSGGEAPFQLPPWLQGEGIGDKAAGAEVVEASFMDSLLAEVLKT